MAGNRNKIEMIQIKERIKELHYARKYSLIEIANILNIGESTVHRYMRKIEKEFEESHKPKTVEDYTRENTEAYEKIIEKMWIVHDQESDPYKKASILKMIEKARNAFIVDLQNLHVIPKPKETTDMNVKSELLERLKMFDQTETEANEKKDET